MSVTIREDVLSLGNNREIRMVWPDLASRPIPTLEYFKGLISGKVTKAKLSEVVEQWIKNEEEESEDLIAWFEIIRRKILRSVVKPKEVDNAPQREAGQGISHEAVDGPRNADGEGSAVDGVHAP